MATVIEFVVAWLDGLSGGARRGTISQLTTHSDSAIQLENQKLKFPELHLDSELFGDARTMKTMA
jgi:hypothetical protein